MRNYVGLMMTVYEWRGAFTNQEANALHAEACGFAPTNAGLLSLDPDVGADGGDR